MEKIRVGSGIYGLLPEESAVTLGLSTAPCGSPWRNRLITLMMTAIMTTTLISMIRLEAKKVRINCWG
jgi:hypothetical protein